MDNPEKLSTQGTQHKDKQNKKHNTICVGHHYTLTNINNVNNTRALLQRTRGKDDPNIVFMRKTIQHLIKYRFLCGKTFPTLAK